MKQRKSSRRECSSFGRSSILLSFLLIIFSNTTQLKYLSPLSSRLSELGCEQNRRTASRLSDFLKVHAYSRRVPSSLVQSNMQTFSSSFELMRLSNIAEQITVRIQLGLPDRTNASVGSGTIISRQGSVYTVVTAAHVLNDLGATYSIQTPDGKNYGFYMPIEFYEGKDIAIVKFRSSAASYKTPESGFASELSVGERVYAAGFPLENRSRIESRLTFRVGEVSLFLSHPLENGYRLAYTSMIDVGMSGGPVLNSRGEVVGINGMRDDPLWSIPARYDNGSFPSSEIQEILEDSSLAIAVEDL